jgi:hypothetical protein
VRRASRVDFNQREIVAALRGAGATVQLLHAVGEGCPDLLIGYKGANFLLECKDGAKPPSAQKLTPQQEIWHRDWRGRSMVVNSPEAALAAIGVIAIRGTIE